MSKPTCAWPYKVGGGESIGVDGDGQVREGRVRESRGMVRNCIQDSPHHSWFKLRLPEAGLGLARVSWSLSVVLPASSSATWG